MGYSSSTTTGEQQKEIFPETTKLRSFHYISNKTGIIHNTNGEAGTIVGNFTYNENDNDNQNEISTKYNYTLFLYSTSKKHLAISLDMEQNNMQNDLIQCLGNQYISFSILDSSEYIRNNSENNNEETSKNSSDPVFPYSFPISSYKIWSLLNRPLNESLLRKSDTKPKNENIFEKANNLIDSLHTESEYSYKMIKETAAQDISSNQFPMIMKEKLSNSIEWRRLVSSCSKLQHSIIIPFRSVKLHIMSDELANNASFKINYKFISELEELEFSSRGIFYCRNRRQIPINLKCDGFDDCDDASDESTSICQVNNYKSSHGHHTPLNDNNNSILAAVDAKRHDRLLRYYDFSLLHCCNASESWQAMMKSKDKSSGSPVLSRSKRIIGGSLVPTGRWPAQVSLGSDYVTPISHYCAGTLIHPQYVLSAGHCVTRVYVKDMKILLGVTSLANDQTTETRAQVRYVQELILYPGLDGEQIYKQAKWSYDEENDLVLLRLDQPALLRPNVMPACLASTSVANGTKCETIGWGRTQGSGNDSLLKTIEETISDSRDCYDTMFCTKNVGRGNAICLGDSGGPLYCNVPEVEKKSLFSSNDSVAHNNNNNNDNCSQLSGITSASQYLKFSLDKCSSVGTSIYTDVAAKAHWIESTIKLMEKIHPGRNQ